MSMTINSIASMEMQRSMQQLATGQRINNASDDAAGLAMAENLHKQIAGLEQGNRNTADMQNLVTTAEGALGQISDTLNRVRELTISSQNSTLSDSDRGIIQNEINQLLSSVEQIANNTEFNGQSLLTGEFVNKNVASNPNGTGMEISIESSTLEALGLESFNASDADSLRSLDNAISSVTESRARMGANINTMEHGMNSNSITALNLAASKSRIMDTDMARVASEKEKNQLINQYNIEIQRKDMEEQQQQQLSIFY